MWEGRLPFPLNKKIKFTSLELCTCRPLVYYNEIAFFNTETYQRYQEQPS